MASLQILPLFRLGWSRSHSLSDADFFRHRLFVQTLIVLFGAGALVSALVFLGFLFTTQGDRLVLKPRPATAGEEGILQPFFSGRDSSGQTFTLRADKALLDHETRQIMLTAPAFANAQGISVQADKGVYTQNAQTLYLEGQVRLADRTGQEFVTARATLDIHRGEVRGFDSISGHASFGTISADRFTIREDGRWITLEGGVRTRLETETDHAAKD